MRIVHFGRESLVFVVVVVLYSGVIAKRQAQPFAHQYALKLHFLKQSISVK
jgi:hypothetical protein